MPHASQPQATPAWQGLALSAAQPLPPLRELLQDSARTHALRAQACGLTLDFSRQRLTSLVLQQLLDLARQQGLADQRDALFAGERINRTEDRAVLHMALRAPAGDSQGIGHPWPADITAQVLAERERMLALAERIRQGHWLGPRRQPITDLVAIGIGGSDLGPRMAVHALQQDRAPAVRVHFVSNPDAVALHDVLATLDPLRTGFVVASKTFTTQETLLNTDSARHWLRAAGVSDWARQFIAITTAPNKAVALGFAPEHTLRFWDWVGGRYSLWSSIGLPLAVAVGRERFEAFLAGAHALDTHFRTAPLAQNLPVLMALLGLWQRNFLNAPTQLVTSYSARLGLLPAYLQQMDMESNGKRVHPDGQPVRVATGPIVWGGLGIDGQHAYYQLLHQGTHRVAIDFIGVRQQAQLPDAPPAQEAHLRFNQANLLAQAQALALGRDAQATAASLRAAGLSEAEVQRLTPHRSFDGNVSSNVLWLDALTPFTLGALVALYEHKVFCQAALWQVHAFDQWGVELGKVVAQGLQHSLHTGELPAGVDSATAASLRFLREVPPLTPTATPTVAPTPRMDLAQAPSA